MRRARSRRSAPARTSGSESRNPRMLEPAFTSEAKLSRRTNRESVANLRVRARFGSIGRVFIAEGLSSRTDFHREELSISKTARSTIGHASAAQLIKKRQSAWWGEPRRLATNREEQENLRCVLIALNAT